MVTNEKIPWNPDSQSITVTTDSEIGSFDRLDVMFANEDGKWAGSVLIYFDNEIGYGLRWCSGWTRFSATPQAQKEKTWTITYNFAEQNVVILCNGVKVADMVISDSNCKFNTVWKRRPTQFFFNGGDRASDSYSLSTGH